MQQKQKCVACSGTGKSSQGNRCFPCNGTGNKLSFPTPGNKVRRIKVKGKIKKVY